MAKIKHNNLIDTASEIFRIARDKGIIHLYAEDEEMNGKYLTVKNRRALNFGTCGYLRLEFHEKLKAGAIDAINRYGTQFPMSRSYISNTLYTELEYLIEKIYGVPAVISKNCTISHLAVIPTLIRENDAVILDHLVHSSVQSAVQKLLPSGVNVEMIRHANMEMLEDTILRIKDKYRRIWYMSDGVYSMYGDFAPMKEMLALAEKYEQLYLYVDDAHGTSWTGKHGAGYAMSQMNNQLHPKVVLTATMGKAFGACGGVTLFPNHEWYDQVKVFGGPNTFSVQLEPAILGSAVASAKLHLSDEIYEHQRELGKRISYCNELLAKTTLPLIKINDSPIFFIGTGAMAMTNRLIERLFDDGIYVNTAPFPAVPAKNTGVRITISLNNDYDEIAEMVAKLDYHFHKALNEVDQTNNKIRKAFKLPPVGEAEKKSDSKDVMSDKEELKLEVFESINDVDKNLWNRYLGHRAMFDWDGVKFLEESFSDNELPEENWKFRYFIVKNHSGLPVLVTFCIVGLWKDDIFSKASISEQIEQTRIKDPYYLTSKAVIMGSMFTEGEHLFLDRTGSDWKQAMHLLIEALFKIQDDEETNSLILRDFNANDEEFRNFMIDQGFVKIDMPEACVKEDLNWNTEKEFMKTLSKRSKKHFRQEIRKFEKCFKVEPRKQLNDQELQHTISMFRNVKNNNFAINSFDFPEKLFVNLNNHPDWEIITLKIKKEFEDILNPVAYAFCHINCDNVYSGMFVGMDYNYLHKYGIYRQTLYQSVKRARDLGCQRINLGVSATTEKKKVGSTIYPRIAYWNAKDNFTMELIGSTIASKID